MKPACLSAASTVLEWSNPLIHLDAPTGSQRHAAPAYQPKIALLIGTMSTGGDAVVISQHSIDRGEIGVGSLIDKASVVALLESINASPASRAMRPVHPALVSTSSNKTIWHAPAAVRPMTFRIDGNVVSIRVPWPNLLFKVTRRGMSCVALESGADPRCFQNPVYHAPLMNVHPSTDVCLPAGTALDPRPDETGLLAAQEAMYQTAFSHTNGAPGLNPRIASSCDTPTMFAFWKSLNNKKRFPVAALNPINSTIDQWVNHER